MKIEKDKKIVVGIIFICAIALLSYWLIEKFLVQRTVVKNKNSVDIEGKIPQGPHPYVNKDYSFVLLSDPNQSKSYTDYPDRCSFQVIPITTNCGDITKTCPPAKIIPGFRWYPASKRPPLALTQKITFPNNPVPFCFAKGVPEMGAGSIYDSYYYLTTTKDNRCFAIRFVVHKPNCEMFGDKEQIDKCDQGNEKLDQIPNEYMKTFKFVTASR